MPSPTRVQPSAAEYYARVRGLSVAAATDELLRIMATAKESAKEPGQYRYRNQSDGIDVQVNTHNGCIVSALVRSAKRPPPTVGRALRWQARHVARRNGVSLAAAVAAIRADPDLFAQRTRLTAVIVVEWCDGDGFWFDSDGNSPGK